MDEWNLIQPTISCSLVHVSSIPLLKSLLLLLLLLLYFTHGDFSLVDDLSTWRLEVAWDQMLWISSRGLILMICTSCHFILQEKLPHDASWLVCVT